MNGGRREKKLLSVFCCAGHVKETAMEKKRRFFLENRIQGPAKT